MNDNFNSKLEALESNLNKAIQDVLVYVEEYRIKELPYRYFFDPEKTVTNKLLRTILENSVELTNKMYTYTKEFKY